MKTNLTCTCCGTEITYPQFYNGLPYGYTCIRKVVPDAKQSKVKFVPVESFKVLAERKQYGGSDMVYSVAVICGNRKYTGTVFSSQIVEQNDTVYLAAPALKRLKLK